MLAKARLRVRTGQDHRVLQRGPEPARPGHRVPVVDQQQQLDLLVVQRVVVAQLGAE
jgi:hypothetical protein